MNEPDMKLVDAKVSWNIFNEQSRPHIFGRWLKGGAMFVMTIIILIAVFFITSKLGDLGTIINVIVTLFASIYAMNLSMSMYESWRGCYLNVA